MRRSAVLWLVLGVVALVGASAAVLDLPDGPRSPSATPHAARSDEQSAVEPPGVEIPDGVVLNQSGAVVFTRSGRERSDLYVVAASGSNLRLLMRSASSAAVAPDGRRIAFVRGGAVWIMQSDGAHARRVVLHAVEPAWSSDGGTLYFTRWVEADYGSSIFSIRDDGTHLARITTARGVKSEDAALHGCWPEHRQASASPDGRWIAFTDSPSACTGETHVRFVASARSTGRPVVLEDQTSAPAWSPDGDRLVYEVYDPESSETRPAYLNVSPAQGPSWVLVRIFPSGDAPAWSPAGDWVAFSDGDSLALIQPDGTGRRSLARPSGEGVSYHQPAWLPAN